MLLSCCHIQPFSPVVFNAMSGMIAVSQTLMSALEQLVWDNSNGEIMKKQQRCTVMPANPFTVTFVKTHWVQCYGLSRNSRRLLSPLCGNSRYLYRFFFKCQLILKFSLVCIWRLEKCYHQPYHKSDSLSSSSIVFHFRIANMTQFNRILLKGKNDSKVERTAPLFSTTWILHATHVLIVSERLSCSSWSPVSVLGKAPHICFVPRIPANVPSHPLKPVILGACLRASFTSAQVLSIW